MTRKNFLLSLTAMAGIRAVEGKMLPDEQLAHDRYAESKPEPPARLLDSEPFLQVPAPDSVGVAFAVSAMSAGFVELADNPKLENAVRFEGEGLPMVKIDSRVLQVRLTGLKPATRYWYRVGAAALTHPIGYWTKPTPIVWGKVHAFTTLGESAVSRFAFISDTHGRWDSFELITEQLRKLAPPVAVWAGDVPGSKIDDDEQAVTLFLKPKVTNHAWAAELPTFFLDGNHDYRGEWNARNPTRIMMGRPDSERTAEFRPLLRNFAVRQGAIAMIGLETGEDKPDNHPAHGGLTRFKPYRSLETEWLKAQFRRPEIASAPYKVVFCHIPLFDARPDANPGEVLENWADYQGQCAAEWGPILKANGVQLVICGHKHRLRYDAPTVERPWGQLVGGGPELGYVGSGTNRRADDSRFPTVIEGRVEGDRLVILVHDVFNHRIAMRQEFPRTI